MYNNWSVPIGASDCHSVQHNLHNTMVSVNYRAAMKCFKIPADCALICLPPQYYAPSTTGTLDRLHVWHVLNSRWEPYPGLGRSPYLCIHITRSLSHDNLWWLSEKWQIKLSLSFIVGSTEANISQALLATRLNQVSVWRGGCRIWLWRVYRRKPLCTSGSVRVCSGTRQGVVARRLPWDFERRIEARANQIWREREEVWYGLLLFFCSARGIEKLNLAIWLLAQAVQIFHW